MFSVMVAPRCLKLERSKEYLRTGADCDWPALADDRLKALWRWKLQWLYCTAGLCSELSNCHLRCTPAVEKEDYDVMYSIAGVH